MKTEISAREGRIKPECKSASQSGVRSKPGSLQSVHSIPKSCTLELVRVPSEMDKRSAWPSPYGHIVEAHEQLS